MAQMPTTVRTALAHAGDRTHHHDQEMTPASLSTTSVTTAIGNTASRTDSARRHDLGPPRILRMPGTQ
jgi:hypothetical protein